MILDTAAPMALHRFKPESFKGAPGFYRVAQTVGGSWWLLDPQSRPVFAAALMEGDEQEPSELQAREWGFCARVRGKERREEAVSLSIPRVVTLHLSEGGPVIHSGGARLPDVFDPRWRHHAQERAQRGCAPWLEDPDIIGWRSDDSLDWAWSEPERRPTLLQLCLSLEPSHAAYHAAWEFVLALHEGSFERMAAAWQVPLTNKEMLRSWTQEERGIDSPGYQADHRLWSEQFIRRYCASVGTLLRDLVPAHLRFGPLSGKGPEPELLANHVTLAFDVRSVRWVPGATPVAESVDGPVWREGFTWATEKLYGPEPGPDDLPDATRVERMLRRGRMEFARLVQDRSTIGWTWAPSDEPLLAKAPFSSRLLRSDGTPAYEHTDQLTHLNVRAAERRDLLG
ncbi:MAG TPA: hypothetical protein PLN52_12530 [Opitutaceae bacterium]|nr:hypothetical protein [Opitutaceae bacterium]